MKKLLLLKFILLFSFAPFTKTFGQNVSIEKIDSLLKDANEKKDWNTAAYYWEQSYYYYKYPIMLVRAAGCYAHLKDKERTYVLLDSALRNGYTYTYLLDHDTAFTFLHKDKRWQDIRTKVQEKFLIKDQIFYWGIYFGFLLLLFLLNIFLFFTNRELSYIYLGLMLLSAMQWEMTMHPSHKIFFAKLLPWMHDFIIYNEPGIIFLIGLQVSYFLFSNSFLKLKERLPKANKIFRYIIVVNIILFLQMCFNIELLPKVVNSTIVGICFVFFLITGIMVWRRGHSDGIFYVAASIVFTLGMYLGLVVNTFPVFLVYSYLNIGIFLFFLILSAGVTDQMRVMRIEKEKAQEKALVVLEEKVRERTVEIVKQKDEIAAQKHLVEIKQKEIVDSINYAKYLQVAILTPKSFINKYVPDHFIFYQPKDIVAGDFYWAEASDDMFYIAAADSTGHGIPGALVSVVCSDALNRAVKEFKLKKTGEILDKTRELVIETFSKSKQEVKDGMDISLLCLDKKNKKVYWSGANNPLWYVQNNILLEVKPDKQPIGKSEKFWPFLTHEMKYKENSTFYLFTDGLADQFGGPKGKKFKYKQFSELLLKNSQMVSEKQLSILEKTIFNWKGDLEQVDDMCVIGIRI